MIKKQKNKEIIIQSFQKYFNRFELKYQISFQERDRIISLIRPFMRLDSHVSNNFNYEVRSLYFDSNFYHTFLEKRDGVAIRKKLRIRYYPSILNDTQQQYAFIELKKKLNDNVAKRRIYIPLKNSLKFLDSHHRDTIEFYENASEQDKNTLKEIWFMNKRYNLKPVCIVSYKRQPYVSKFEKSFRVTFDTDLKVRRYNLDLRFGGGSKFIIPPNICVMEIKFNNIIPNWAIKIIQKNDCVQYKISKFATGLEKSKIFTLS